MGAEPERIIALYERHALAWDKDRGRTLFERGWLDRFLSLLPAEAAILDLGCGSGEPLARYVIDRGYRVTGVDSAPTMIALCRERFPAQEWIVADMRELSLGRDFDGILAWDSFFHLGHDDQRRMFSVFRRHAAPRAALMFTSGPADGEAIGCYRGEALYHASLDEADYRATLETEGFAVLSHAVEDPDCHGHTVWLAQRNRSDAADPLPSAAAAATMPAVPKHRREGSMMDDTSKSAVSGIKKSNRRYQSDIIVDMIKRYGFEHIALNPGASYRGLHDSLVNHGENDPPMMLCTHEKIAVQIAHGYARHSGKPMIAIVHNLVGLLHAPMGIYYAYIDRAPVFIIGATGPLTEPKRRPYIDWIHSANVQGEAIRDYIKWDYQPASVDAVPDSFARAYSVMMSGRQGPVYMCYDAALQEAELDHDVRMPPPGAVAVAAPPAPDPQALAKAADTLAAAERPVIVCDYAARPPHGWDHVVAIAETLGARVWDCNSRLNFPGNHPLNLSMAPEKCYGGADVVLTLDLNDFEKPTHVRDISTRTVQSQVPDGATWIDIGFTDLEISKWAMSYARTYHAEQRMHADPVTATPMLTELLKARIAKTPGMAEKIAKRTKETGKIHAALREGWRKQAQESWDLQPMTVGRLALEVWEQIRDEDWVLTAGTMHDWARRLWDFDRPHCHGGAELGTGTQIGTSLGVALANKGTGRLVIDLQPDGDLMFDAGALWMAAKYDIPMLIVMYNNRAYYNDWNHQIVIAKNRGTDPARAHIGMDLYDPDPDFAGLARSLGWWAEGPIENGDDVAGALRRAIEQVKAGKPALVDTVCQRGKADPLT